jgi:phosphotransferase system IIA component
MHYGTNYFSINGEPTIKSKKSSEMIDPSETLTEYDVAEIRKLYNCSTKATKTTTTTTKSTTTITTTKSTTKTPTCDKNDSNTYNEYKF